MSFLDQYDEITTFFIIFAFVVIIFVVIGIVMCLSILIRRHCKESEFESNMRYNLCFVAPGCACCRGGAESGEDGQAGPADADNTCCDVDCQCGPDGQGCCDCDTCDCDICNDCSDGGVCGVLSCVAFGGNCCDCDWNCGDCDICGDCNCNLCDVCGCLVEICAGACDGCNI